MKKNLFVFTDGGARGNPGPGAIGFVVRNNANKIIFEKSQFIGRTTNNVAEYQAVIEALNWIKENVQKFKSLKVQFFLDSKLVVNQLNGLFKIKNKNLQKLILQVRKSEQEIKGNIKYFFIPRHKNYQADNLVNKAFKSISHLPA